MENTGKLKILESSAVQGHLSMLQGIINRMTGNSANCKNWIVTLVAAMLVLLVDKDLQISNAWLCLIPIVLFWLLDSYYLGLERICISIQNEFLKNINNKKDIEDTEFVNELYNVEQLKDGCKQFCSTMESLFSFSTTPFYLIISLVVVFLGNII